MKETAMMRFWRWRIGAASALVGVAGVVSGLRDQLGLVWGLGMMAAAVLGVLLALRGVHHRVDQEEARRRPFYTGTGATAWLLVVLLGTGILPGVLVGLLPEGSARSLAAGMIGVGLASASHGILAATTTPEPQPRPDPVPLGRADRPRG
ncbi:hypothetical protein [Micrococcus sp.]|uniref:hypothetical protein n=1 Tax=Micrococcus sp. TaxID=1271 RepID=UPI002A9114F4|nr:hypothetical protein [Micrococcus sp.]MDY6056101.1 hypothetical protein [Micrococcus sp.]